MNQIETGRYNRRTWSALLLSLAIASGASGAPTEPMSVEEQTLKIDEGVRLHEQGEFDGALAKYREVLAANPKNVTALYEASYTLAAQKQWRACYEMAEKALRGESSFRPQIYIAAGICYDAAGEPKKAIALFKRGLRESPDEAGLWFNLAVVYDRTGDASQAESAFEQAVKAKPDHLSANYALGVLYARKGQRIPALLASLRYLSFDFETERAGTVALSIKDLLLQGVSTEGAGNVTITLPEKGSESPFAASEMMLSIVAASRYLPENKNQSELEWSAGILDSVFESLGDLTGVRKTQCFPCVQYAPFFLTLKEKSLVEPFAYLALQSLDPKGAADWQKANAKKVADLKAWLGENTIDRPHKIG